jgi:hypothetical protein
MQPALAMRPRCGDYETSGLPIPNVTLRKHVYGYLIYVSAQFAYVGEEDLMLAPPDGLTIEDFEQIEAAVLETERGRWFLQEYARRLRAVETAQILAAVERLAVREPHELVARREAAEATVALIEALQKLSSFALGAVAIDSPPSPLEPPMRRGPHGSGDLDRRLSALRELDALDIEDKVKLFG